MFVRISHASISKARKTPQMRLLSRLLVSLQPQWAFLLVNMQCTKQQVKNIIFLFWLLRSQVPCSSGPKLLLSSRVGAPQERPGDPTSSGARVRVPQEHPRVGGPQKPGLVLLRSRSQGRLLPGAAILHHPQMTHALGWGVYMHSAQIAVRFYMDSAQIAVRFYMHSAQMAVGFDMPSAQIAVRFYMHSAQINLLCAS